MFGDLLGPRYQFAVGEAVTLLACNTFYYVLWRGALRVPGQRKRMPVYWLGEPHWDCYYEEELLPINALPF